MCVYCACGSGNADEQSSRSFHLRENNVHDVLVASTPRCVKAGAFTYDMIPITERFLMDTGGWQAMKHAKALFQMGRVVSFNYTPPILHGVVREGDIEFRAGLKIRSYGDVENLCSVGNQLNGEPFVRTP
jgi:hypothetical protein